MNAASSDDPRFMRLAASPVRDRTSGASGSNPLFGPRVRPLNDEQRALAFSALRSLLGNIAEALIGTSEDEFADAKAVASAAETSPTVQTPAMISALIMRAEQHRLGTRLASASLRLSEGTGDAGAATGMIDMLAADEDQQMQRRAILYREARAARADDNDMPVLQLSELPAPLAAECVWNVAASLGRSTDPRLTHRRQHQKIVDRAHAILSKHDVARSPQYLATRLAARMEERQEIDGSLLSRAAGAGDTLLLAAIVAVSANISHLTAWSLLFEADFEATMALLKAAGIGRHEAARLAAMLSAARATGASIDPIGPILNEMARIFDAVPADLAADLLAYWQLNAEYRAAVEEIGSNTV